MNLVVTCAIIVKDGLVLSAKRGPNMRHPLEWEFPGGKVEPGEEPEGCIVREIGEELGIEVEVVGAGPAVFMPHVSGRILELLPFVCRVSGGEMHPREHAQVRWCTAEELAELDWAEADIEVLSWWREQGGSYLTVEKSREQD